VHGGIVWSLDHARIKHLEEHLLLISGRPPPSLQALQPHLLPRPPIIHSPPRSPTLVTRLSYEGSYSPSLLFFYFLSLSSTRSPTFIIYLCVISFDLPPLPIATKLSKGREKVTHTHKKKKKDTCSCLLAESLVHRRDNPQIRPSRRPAISPPPLPPPHRHLSQLQHHPRRSQIVNENPLVR
jgi:hypothetical protein